MKSQELTFQQIPRAIIHQWKWLLMLTGLFLVIGIGAGFAFSSLASAESTGTAEAMQSDAFQPEIFNLNYYNEFYAHLAEQSRNLYTYVDTVRLDTTITPEQAEEIKIFLKEIKQYDEVILPEISRMFAKPNQLYLPDMLRQDAIDEYTRLQEVTRKEIFRSEHANQLIQSIGGVNTTDEAINETYASLLQEAAQLGQLQLNMEAYERNLDMLNNHYDEVQRESQAMEKMLLDAEDALQTLMENGNALMQKIAATNHIDVNFHYLGEELEVLIDHTHRMATQEEAFVVFVVLFGLIGVCVGGYLAVCKEWCLMGKRSQEES